MAVLFSNFSFFTPISANECYWLIRDIYFLFIFSVRKFTDACLNKYYGDKKRKKIKINQKG